MSWCNRYYATLDFSGFAEKNIIVCTFFVLKQPHPLWHSGRGRRTDKAATHARAPSVPILPSFPLPTTAALSTINHSCFSLFCAVLSAQVRQHAVFPLTICHLFLGTMTKTLTPVEGGREWKLPRISYERERTRKSHNISNRSALDKYYLHTLPEQSIC